jgi:peptidoglycan/LPS O-acetylase OafA/YrhL
MLKSIQLLRAISAWMVVFYHTQQIYFGFGESGLISVFFSRYGAMGVDIFFVISGFVIYISTINKNISPLQFMANRIIRIVPAYWVFSIITALLVVYFRNLMPFTQFEPDFFVKSLLFIPSYNPSGIGLFPLLTVGWTLACEISFYLVFCFALFSPARYRLFCICVGLMILQLGVPQFGSEFTFYAEKGAYEFLYGIIVGVLYEKKWLSKISFRYALIIFAVAIAVIATKDNLPPNGWLHTGNYIFIIGIPSSLIVAAALSQEASIPNIGPLMHLGNWSYATYLSHVIVLSIAYKASQFWEIRSSVTIFSACIVILVCSYLSYAFVERKASLYLKAGLGLQHE